MLRLFCLSLAALALGLVPAATADSNGPKSSSQDFATGSAKFTAVDAHVIVDAHSGPAGEDPQGHFALDQAGLIDYFADVTCLNVVGNQAVMGGVITKQKSGITGGVGTGVLQFVVDNGEPGTALPTPDRSVTIFTGAPPLACPPPDPFPFFPVDQGNYVVNDAP